MLKFVISNNREIYVSNYELKEIITTELSNNIYYKHNNVLKDINLLLFFQKSLFCLEKLKRIAYYILFFTENIVFTSYIYSKSLDLNDALNYLESQKKLLKNLRILYYEIKKSRNYKEIYKNIDKMINYCRDFAIDPF